jgi:3-mercaptopyruvate sulfurtransferase SseA
MYLSVAYGHSNISILEGGIDEWIKYNGPIQSGIYLSMYLSIYVSMYVSNYL